MSAESIIKTQARNLLKKYWAAAICAMAITFIPFYIVDGSTTLLSCLLAEYVSDTDLATLLAYSIGYPFEIVAWILFSPLINGMIRAYYRAAKNGEFEIGDVFYYFSRENYGKALLLNLNLILRMLLPALILFLPLIAFEVISNYFVSEDFYGSTIYNDSYFILAALSTITTTLYATRYFTVFTVSVDYESLSVKEIFECNRMIMKNKTGSAAKLICSFIPWLLLCLLILPALYVIPYMTQSLCVSAKWMNKATFEVNRV